MKRKRYEKPSLVVVVLTQTCILMVSPAQAGVQNYDWNDTVEE